MTSCSMLSVQLCVCGARLDWLFFMGSKHHGGKLNICGALSVTQAPSDVRTGMQWWPLNSLDTQSASAETHAHTTYRTLVCVCVCLHLCVWITAVRLCLFVLYKCVYMCMHVWNRCVCVYVCMCVCVSAYTGCTSASHILSVCSLAASLGCLQPPP